MQNSKRAAPSPASAPPAKQARITVPAEHGGMNRLSGRMLERRAREPGALDAMFVEARTFDPASGRLSKQPMFGVLEKRTVAPRWREPPEWAGDMSSNDSGTNDEQDVQYFLRTHKRAARLSVLQGKFVIFAGTSTASPKFIFVRDVTNSRRFLAAPTRRHVTNLAAKWANWAPAHEHIQRALRGEPGPAPNNRNARWASRVRAGLERYFRNFALRAPERPLHQKDVKYMYRGIVATPAMLERLRSGGLEDKGFVAFSLDPEVSEAHAGVRSRTRNGVQIELRLAVADVPRGTPWVWFRKVRSTPHASFQRYVGIRSQELFEVLLPPGALVAKPRQNNNGMYLDVTYRRRAA